MTDESDRTFLPAGWAARADVRGMPVAMKVVSVYQSLMIVKAARELPLLENIALEAWVTAAEAVRGVVRVTDGLEAPSPNSLSLPHWYMVRLHSLSAPDAAAYARALLRLRQVRAGRLDLASAARLAGT